MQLLTSKKVSRDFKLQETENKVALLKLEIKETEALKKLTELHSSWEPEKKKAWKDFCQFNQDIQGKKALLLQEIEELETKKENLIENLKSYVEL